MMFRSGLLLLLLTALAVSPTGAATLLEMEHRAAGVSGADTVSLRIILDGTQLRIDSFEGSEEAPSLTILFHADSEVLFIVDHAGEECLRIDREAVEARSEQLQDLRRELEQQLADLPPEQRALVERMMVERGLETTTQASIPEIRATTEIEKIAGYSCRKHQALTKGKVTRELWIAPWSELGLHESYVKALLAFAALVDDMRTAFSEGLPLGEALDERSLAGFVDPQGFPVLVRELRDGEAVSEHLLRSVSEIAAHPGFKPPPSYRMTEMDAPATSGTR